MATLVLRLNSEQLENPDLDIRYELPDLLTERSNGNIQDAGYDYVGENPPYLVLFLEVADLEAAIESTLDVIENVRVLDNDLRNGVVVAVKQAGSHKAVYPNDFVGEFLPSANQ